MVTCENCEKSFYESEQSKYMINLTKCAHYICRSCFIQQIKTEYLTLNGNLTCRIRGCNEPYTDLDYLALLGKTKYDNLKKNLQNNKLNQSKGQSHHEKQLLCRYCDKQFVLINKSLPAHLQDICNDLECQIKLSQACLKKLECGHSCCGIKNEKYCLPCLNHYCLMKGESGCSELCQICQWEKFSNAPCVQSKCKHIFHYNCIKKLISIKQARIQFINYMCPLCKLWMEFPQECDLQIIIEEKKELYDQVLQLAKQRLRRNKRNQDKCLADSRNKYYKSPGAYALSIYSYYLCYKCQQPYFGGIKKCEENLDEEKFKENELICPVCSSIENVYKCPKHGTKFLEYKCKFCCSIASYFCWGTTHFCAQCHSKQNNGDLIANYPKEQLPKCLGKEKCPLKIDHKPNGEEYCFCVACLSYREEVDN